MNPIVYRYALVIVLAIAISIPLFGKIILPIMYDDSSALAFRTLPLPTIKPTPVPVPPSVAFGVQIPVENRENSAQYTFINPLLFTETDKKMFTEFGTFNGQINTYIQSAINAHKADSISVYFRDLNSGHWTGINEDKTYEPSSMLKVVVMISYLRKAFSDASQSTSSIDSILSSKLYYPGEDIAGQNYPPTNMMATGTYSISELINDMIINSDNVALDVLVSNNEDGFQNVYNDFRLPVVPTTDSTDFMTAKSYSVIFRTLYNSTYLPWDVSEYALKIMASTTFTKGLVAGVPPDTIVSHKFGEHTNIGPNNKILWRELHDCGNVYYDSRPYLICIMTSGQDFTKLESVVSDISHMVYRYVSALPPSTKN